MILMYYGDSNRRHWTPTELEHVLAYTYKTGVNAGIKEWFFPSLLYIEFKHGTHKFSKPEGSFPLPMTKADGEWLMDRFFSETTINGEHEGLRALEEKIAALKTQLGEPKQRHKVVLTIPVPYYVSGAESWGSIIEEGHEVELDMSSDTDRIKAVKWYVDEILSRYNAKNYQNFDLDGLYFVQESTDGCKNIMGAIGEYVQSKGQKFYWIPYCTADGKFEWESLNVTNPYLQTGYFWKDGERNPLMTERELLGLCDDAIAHSMGMEYEVDRYLFPNRASSDYSVIDADRMGRIDTLTDAYEEKRIFGGRDITYYMDNDTLIGMVTSTNPRLMAYMDRFAELVSNNKYRTNAELLLLRHMMG